MNEDLVHDVHLVMQQAYSEASERGNTEPEEEVIHVHHFPDARIIELPDGTVIFKKNEDTTTNIPTVESTLEDSQTNHPLTAIAYLTVSMYLFLILSCLTFQIYVLINSFTVTVTVLSKSQQLTVNGTLQLGRVVSPITVSQSATIPTTGHAHQDAKAATGYITFYNGQSNQITVPTGTTLTGTSGEQIVTDVDANIPAESGSIPPTLGQVTVSAHAVTPGSRGNIPLGDINQPCCFTAIRAINTTSFQGGQDERDFSTVTKTDITSAAAPLKVTLNQSVQGALQGQLKNGEALQANPCSPTVTPDHQIGQEAPTVKVTVSLTCSGIAYNTQELTNRAMQLLTTQATGKLGEGFSILGNPDISITQASELNTKVILSFNAQSTWIYALSSAEQRHIKKIIAGKTKENAMQLLSSLPSIERVSMQFSGFGDDTRIPKNLSNIHLVILAGI